MQTMERKMEGKICQEIWFWGYHKSLIISDPKSGGWWREREALPLSRDLSGMDGCDRNGKELRLITEGWERAFLIRKQEIWALGVKGELDKFRS